MSNLQVFTIGVIYVLALTWITAFGNLSVVKSFWKTILATLLLTTVAILTIAAVSVIWASAQDLLYQGY